MRKAKLDISHIKRTRRRTVKRESGSPDKELAPGGATTSSSLTKAREKLVRWTKFQEHRRSLRIAAEIADFTVSF